jgi:subtilisin family serine protease
LETIQEVHYVKKLLSFVIIILMSMNVFMVQNTVFAESDKAPVIILFAPGANGNAGRAAVTSAGGEVTHVFTIMNAVSALVPPAAIEGLKNNPLVSSVDPDVEVNAVDILADNQISADNVWDQGYTGGGVRLAILDTGIATTHPEFAGRIVACHTEVIGTSTCEDDHGHGTHAAGTAGAAGVNPNAKGVAPSVQLMSDKVLNKRGSGSLSGIILGIEWAVNNNAQIISMSLGTSPVDGGGTLSNCDSTFPSFTTSINNAVAAGVTVVAAAGNDGSSGLGAPGCISSVIAVGAVTSSDSVASFSSRGVAMADHGVAAPGVYIYSSYLNNGYAYMSGTSMATPAVAGTVALMLSKNPNQSPADIRNNLFSTSDCVTGGCPNNNIGHGRVNALSAVNHVTTGGTTFDFAVSLSPTGASVTQGGSAGSTVSVSLLSGSAQTVSLTSSVSPAASGISVYLSSASGSPTFTSGLSIGTSSSTSPGTYTVTITGIASGDLTRTASFTLDVAASVEDFDFAITLVPESASVTQGGDAASTVWVSLLSGTAQTVSLTSSISSGASGVSVYLSSASGLPIGTSSSTSPGTYTVTITGVSGGLTRTASFNLTVEGAAPTTPLQVTVSTDQLSYPTKSWASITVTVTDNGGSHVAGATVTVTITAPDGKTWGGTGTTDSTGQVQFKYRIHPKADLGTYRVDADASAAGYSPGGASTAFTVN